ncbi:uncharacterized protein LOC133725835 [Rosa rugosa]|uniref:uncharacterized protein LOC133725835 n=1 Tax=Rosa rugosa TaxID=74645 RepID=UPI002B413B05|nr:uncharacterized protein LOC133725835 [Rosa rugosa]
MRCTAIYKNGIVNPDVVISNDNFSSLEWANVKLVNDSPTSTRVSSSNITTWKPPPENFTKINSDGAWDPMTKNGGTGTILRDHSGHFLAGGSYFNTYNPAIESEAMALIQGCFLAARLNKLNVICECDCKDLVEFVNNQDCGESWRLNPFLEDLLRFKSLFSNFTCTWTPREANRSADAAAKLAKQRLLSQEWMNYPPASLVSTLRCDVQPCPQTE